MVNGISTRRQRHEYYHSFLFLCSLLPADNTAVDHQQMAAQGSHSRRPEKRRVLPGVCSSLALPLAHLVLCKSCLLTTASVVTHVPEPSHCACMPIILLSSYRYWYIYIYISCQVFSKHVQASLFMIIAAEKCLKPYNLLRKYYAVEIA